MQRKYLIAGIIVAIIIGAVFGYYFTQSEEKLIVYCAGSLTVPFQKIKNSFESENSCNVYIEAGGSVTMARKIVELGEKADLLAVADYKVIENFLMPNYTKWYTIFATNELVIAYTNKSKYAGEINSNNWYKILMKDDVKIGFASPNQDPCGYRSLILFKLADLYYKEKIFSELIEKNLNVYCDGNSNFTISVSDDPSLMRDRGRIYIKPKSIELIADLETGTIDYAVEYRSVAIQHNLKFVRLPDEMNLGNYTLRDLYSKITVKLVDGNMIKGDAIMYAITIPNNAQNPSLAKKFYDFVVGDVGKKIIEECGMHSRIIKVGG